MRWQLGRRYQDRGGSGSGPAGGPAFWGAHMRGGFWVLGCVMTTVVVPPPGADDLACVRRGIWVRGWAGLGMEVEGWGKTRER